MDDQFVKRWDPFNEKDSVKLPGKRKKKIKNLGFFFYFWIWE